MSLKGVAKHTLEIVERGGYETESGSWVEIGPEVAAAVAGTQLLTPAQLHEWLAAAPSPEASPEASPARPGITVTGESTQAAARRLVVDEGQSDLVLLNFASAKNAGGGFINGAKAQEEDLARCSALYPCLLAAPEYYYANRAAHVDALYTDHMIWSPSVPFFRVDSRSLLERSYVVSVITAPAPNAGVHRERRGSEAALAEALHRRAGMVLALAEAKRHRNLLLGAWGCGVFRNEPATVAEAFGSWLEHPLFADSFVRVCFAIYDRKEAPRLAFERRFAS